MAKPSSSYISISPDTLDELLWPDHWFLRGIISVAQSSGGLFVNCSWSGLCSVDPGVIRYLGVSQRRFFAAAGQPIRPPEHTWSIWDVTTDESKTRRRVHYEALLETWVDEDLNFLQSDPLILSIYFLTPGVQCTLTPEPELVERVGAEIRTSRSYPAFALPVYELIDVMVAKLFLE